MNLFLNASILLVVHYDHPLYRSLFLIFSYDARESKHSRRFTARSAGAGVPQLAKVFIIERTLISVLHWISLSVSLSLSLFFSLSHPPYCFDDRRSRWSVCQQSCNKRRTTAKDNSDKIADTQYIVSYTRRVKIASNPFPFVSFPYSCHGIENRHAAKHEKRPSQKLETSWPFSL